MAKFSLDLKPIVIFAIFMGITFMVIVSIWQVQRENTINQSEVAVERWTRLLQSRVYNDIDSIGSVANFFHATDKKDWVHFHKFGKAVIHNSESLVALQWMKKVYINDLDEHLSELAIRYPQAELFTTTEEDTIVYGQNNEDNIPIYVATDIYPPTDANLKVLGFFSRKERFVRVEESISESRSPNLSDKVTLLQDDILNQEPSDGFLVYYPVFIGDSNELKGIVIGVLRASVYFDSLVTQTMKSSSVGIQIMDKGHNSDDDPVLYQSQRWSMPHSYQLSSSLYFPNRTWTLQFKFVNEIAPSDKISLFFIGLSGLVISLLIYKIVYKSSKQKEILEIELEKRTKELNYLVNHDPNTNTLNRRAFNQVIDNTIADNASFSLITFDVDSFKKINDKHGHPIGDEALRHIAMQVTAVLKTPDKLFRVGGDEFYVISAINDKNSLVYYADEIRLSISEHPLVLDKDIRLTISIGAGIWQYEPKDIFVQKIDLELYKSKESGRNCTSILGVSDDIS